MTNMHGESPSTGERVERLTDPDPFAVPRRVRQQLKTYPAAVSQLPSDVDYLWLHVSTTGIGAKQPDTPEGHPLPSTDQWMNVVDEAAALGVRWLVVTLDTRLTDYP